MTIEFKYNNKAKRALSVFFRVFNDIDIFVEDRGDDVFYQTILERIVHKRIKIFKIFPLEGRDSVIRACENDQDDDEQPRIYIIDGDLEFVFKQPPNTLKKMIRLNAYCIENYLIDKHAIIEVLFENSGKLDRNKLESDLNYNSWVDEMIPDLINLFIIFAVCKNLSPDIPTIARGIGIMVKNTLRGPRIDLSKVKKITAEIRNTLVQIHGDARIQELEDRLKKEWPSNREVALSIISGKDYLLPLLLWHMRSIVKCEYRTDSIRLRLARHCSLDRFSNLRNSIFLILRNKHDKARELCSGLSLTQ